jgi:hypothetical protein
MIVHTKQTTQLISVFLLYYEETADPVKKSVTFFRFFPVQVIALESRT